MKNKFFLFISKIRVIKIRTESFFLFRKIEKKLRE